MVAGEIVSPSALVTPEKEGAQEVVSTIAAPTWAGELPERGYLSLEAYVGAKRVETLTWTARSISYRNLGGGWLFIRAKVVPRPYADLLGG